MHASSRLFLSSGDLIADRRYGHAQDFLARGDLDAAADLLAQAVEQAPGFASAWFALGDVAERRGNTQKAIAAFERARALDAEDRHGAGVRLARLGAADACSAMTAGYVRAVFDQYAADFDRALLEDLDYRGPKVLHDAVLRACRETGRAPVFDRALDLGCGTGLAGVVFAPSVDVLVGVDLSPRMAAFARRRGCYSAVEVGDMLEYLRTRVDRNADLLIAADSLVYIADLLPLLTEAARVLDRHGLMAFTLESHDGEGAALGAKLRYAHAAGYVRDVLAAARLTPVVLDATWTRTEGGVPVPGLVVAVRRDRVGST